MTSATALPQGLKVLIVEDETFIAFMIEDMLDELGCVVAQAISSLDEGLRVADATDAQAAILDVNVAGKEVFPLAEKLRARGIPFVFSTGYGADGLPPQWRGHPVVTKPFELDALRAALAQAVTAA